MNLEILLGQKISNSHFTSLITLHIFYCYTFIGFTGITGGSRGPSSVFADPFASALVEEKSESHLSVIYGDDYKEDLCQIVITLVRCLKPSGDRWVTLVVVGMWSRIFVHSAIAHCAAFGLPFYMSRGKQGIQDNVEKLFLHSLFHCSLIVADQSVEGFLSEIIPAESTSILFGRLDFNFSSGISSNNQIYYIENQRIKYSKAVQRLYMQNFYF